MVPTCASNTPNSRKYSAISSCSAAQKLWNSYCQCYIRQTFIPNNNFRITKKLTNTKHTVQSPNQLSIPYLSDKAKCSVGTSWVCILPDLVVKPTCLGQFVYSLSHRFTYSNLCIEKNRRSTLCFGFGLRNQNNGFQFSRLKKKFSISRDLLQ